MDLLRKLFTSRKFVVTLASVIGLALTKYLKVEVDQSTIMEFVILIGSYIVGESLVGFGKGAAKVEAIVQLNSDNTISPADTKLAVEQVKSV